MKAILVIACLFVAGFASITDANHMSTMWEAWKAQNKKSYSALEETARFGIFTHNYKKIMKFNEENDTPQLAVNKFADLTASEFKAKHASCAFYETNQELVQSKTQYIPSYGSLPASVDWRAKGAVTAVKNQGQCGSCWTFSTTGALEGLYFQNKGKLLSFSEQQIVDCDTTDDGCNGGLPYQAMKYTADSGLETEDAYPYTGTDGTCNAKKLKSYTTNSNYKLVQTQSAAALKQAIVNQPVSIAIEADQNVFQFYSSGVITKNCGDSLDHAVLAVGYDTFNGDEAFIVKNSWGADWGIQGYVYISTNSSPNNGNGVCGILGQPVVPVW